MKRKLKDILTVSSGIYSSGDAMGDTIYLQTRHFNDENIIEIIPRPEVYADEKIGKHLLKQGEILFAAKGTRNFAVVFDEKIGKAVASSTFLVLKLNSEFRSIVLPEYVIWWLNNTDTQKILKSLSIGSALPSISKATLMELEIPVPDISKQRLITRIYALKQKETDIKKRLMLLNETLLNHKILNILNK